MDLECAHPLAQLHNDFLPGHSLSYQGLLIQQLLAELLHSNNIIIRLFPCKAMGLQSTQPRRTTHKGAQHWMRVPLLIDAHHIQRRPI